MNWPDDIGEQTDSDAAPGPTARNHMVGRPGLTVEIVASLTTGELEETVAALEADRKQLLAAPPVEGESLYRSARYAAYRLLLHIAAITDQLSIRPTNPRGTNR